MTPALHADLMIAPPFSYTPKQQSKSRQPHKPQGKRDHLNSDFDFKGNLSRTTQRTLSFQRDNAPSPPRLAGRWACHGAAGQWEATARPRELLPVSEVQKGGQPNCSSTNGFVCYFVHEKPRENRTFGGSPYLEFWGCPPMLAAVEAGRCLLLSRLTPVPSPLTSFGTLWWTFNGNSCAPTVLEAFPYQSLPDAPQHPREACATRPGGCETEAKCDV